MAAIDITRTWIIALENTTVILEEPGDIIPHDIKCMYQTSRRPGDTVVIVGVDPVINHRPAIPNPGVAVPAMLNLKLQLSVSAAN